MIDFRILGPLVVEVGQRELTVSAPRQRVILAALLLSAKQIVSVDRLQDFVWDGTPPPSGPAVVRTYVMRLRQALGPKAGARIITRTPGYLIEVDEEETDLGRFNNRRDKAGVLAAAGDLEGASAELTEALSAWREPLHDIDSTTLRDIEVRHLEERYFQTLSWRLDLDLQLGRHASLVPELWRLTREHPLREALVARLMLALFRSGRQCDALNVFQQTRALLVEQLATEPGAELQEMQARILAAEGAPPSDPVPAAARPSARITSSRPQPAQLPAALPDFVARRPPVDDGPGGGDPFDPLAGDPTLGPAATTVISGGGGIGKTALAVHTAHAYRGEFAHGQLYASLGGSGGQPAHPSSVLARFLRDLGVPHGAVPQDEAELVAMYRSVVADRKLLIVLDDAANTAQVRPLIPGGARSRVIITSRDRLAGLEGARTVVLRRMDKESSLALLGAVVGRTRVESERMAAQQIVRISGGLPLALRIIGIRLRQQPYRPLADMAARLAAPERLLDELSVGDLVVRDCFARSYAALSTPVACGVGPARVLRTLGTPDTSTFTAASVAERLDCSRLDAEDALDRLVDADLLEQDGFGRYFLCDVVRAYAREMDRATYGTAPQTG
ncbi:BTAD domain-containing putative transcriptional regulator [Streptomyces sp. NPDC058171]